VVAFISATPGVFNHRAGDEIEIVPPTAISQWLRDLSWRARVGAEACELHERRAASDRFAFRLDESTQTRACPGNSCAVDFDNRSSRETIFNAMEAAQSSIEMQVYIVEDGRFMDQLGAHLIRAARRGVSVRLLVDALFSRHEALGMHNPILDALRRQRGIDVRAKDPVPVTDLLELQALKRRDHRKLFVIDGERAFVSGRNAGDAYYTGFDEVAVTDGTLHERIPWLDAHVEVRGPLVGEISDSFERAWEASGGVRRLAPAEGPGVGGALARLVVHDGDEDANGMAAYEAILDAAEDHVYIVNDFPVVSRLVAAVRRAVGRGVRVRLLTGSALARRDDGSFFRGPIYRELFEHMTKGRLEPLMRRGLEVYQYRTPPGLPLIVARGGAVRPYVHAKLMAADGRVVSVGSANLDATASYWEREANIVIEDPESVAVVEAWVEAALEHSVRIGPQDEHWLKETRLREVVSRLWPDSLYS
jgi:phosphatidylserine/phosphatidylglycerophosphate/cardiolipin synthase-like enzyme